MEKIDTKHLDQPILPNMTSRVHKMSAFEFTSMMALLMSLVALAIDAILPALGEISRYYNLKDANQVQLCISILFVGLGFGQMFYGPLSDSIGRKKSIYIGMAFYILGCLISYLAESFNGVLLGRFFQGFGAAGPRIISVALVRDQYKGEAMAKTMSLIMTIFILVPALAPGIGLIIMKWAGWRAIFFVLLGLGLVSVIWFGLRQCETLDPINKKDFSFAVVLAGVKEVFKYKTSLYYILASACGFGAFVGYLSSVQQIFHDIYKTSDLFPVYFATLALAIGSAAFFNSRLVMKHGMRKLVNRAINSICVLSSIFLIISFSLKGVPPLYWMMVYLLLAFFNFGILFGNFNSLAMEPLGHIAGVAAAVVASIQTLFSVPIGAFIGWSFNGTILPMVLGFLSMSFLSLVFFRKAISLPKGS